VAYTAAIALAGAAAWFSIRGMAALFLGSPVSVICMAVAVKSAKLVTAGWLALASPALACDAVVWRVVQVAQMAGAR
jgi:hypothetical protein